MALFIRLGMARVFSFAYSYVEYRRMSARHVSYCYILHYNSYKHCSLTSHSELTRQKNAACHAMKNLKLQIYL